MRTTVEHRELGGSRRTPDKEIVPVGRLADPAEARADEMAERARSVASDYRHGSIRRSPAAHSSAAVDGIGLRTSALDRASAGAQSLAPVQREHLESAYDTSLDNVRVHTGAAAGQLAAGIGASAFTRGNDIYFGAGEYRPDTDRGAHVLAHEVAHTLESSSGGGGGGESVRRFPATAITSPVPWKDLTASVFRPGEGVSGGVYILSSKDKNGQIKKVVVKPVFSGKNGAGDMESPEAVVFGDRALRQLFGVNTPESRFTKKGTTEYADLYSLCAPYAPAKNKKTFVHGLDEADAFVVMGAVEGSSLAGTAAKSANDNNSFDLLQRTLFDPSILEQFGNLAIADLVLGNGDRVGLGAGNLGNVMVSSANGKLDLWAIDTLAQLPKMSPTQLKQGKTGLGGEGWKKDIDGGPGRTLDRVFGTIAQIIESNVDPQVKSSPNAPHTELRQRYARDRAIVVGHFTQGWNAALQNAAVLSSQAAPRQDGATDKLDSLTGQGLRQNLKLIGGAASGKSYDESADDALAVSLQDYVKSIDWESLLIPHDGLMPEAFAKPSTDVLNAEPPTGSAVDPAGSLAFSKATIPNVASDAGKFAGLVDAAHLQVDQEVGKTKTRRQGLKKVEVPRNRNQLGHFVVNSQAAALGAVRLKVVNVRLSKIEEELVLVNNATFEHGQGGAVAHAIRRVVTRRNSMRQTAETYGRLVPIAASGLQAAPKVLNKVTLLEVNTNAAKALVSANSSFDRFEKLNLTAAAAKIK